MANAYPVETKLSTIQQVLSFRVENPVLNDFEVDGFYFSDTEYIGHLSQRFTYDAKIHS